MESRILTATNLHVALHVARHNRSLSPLSLDLTLAPTTLILSRRRVTAAPVNHRPDHRCPLSPSLHLAAAPLLSNPSLSVSLPIRFEGGVAFFFSGCIATAYWCIAGCVFAS
ncbi:hypothetical protein QL285_062713 [Trifolium repens]|nr:hypothetical protein QL285_062713 [Trifolium repens]